MIILSSRRVGINVSNAASFRSYRHSQTQNAIIGDVDNQVRDFVAQNAVWHKFNADTHLLPGKENVNFATSNLPRLLFKTRSLPFFVMRKTMNSGALYGVLSVS